MSGSHQMKRSYRIRGGEPDFSGHPNGSYSEADPQNQCRQQLGGQLDMLITPNATEKVMRCTAAGPNADLRSNTCVAHR